MEWTDIIERLLAGDICGHGPCDDGRTGRRETRCFPDGTIG